MLSQHRLCADSDDDGNSDRALATAGATAVVAGVAVDDDEGNVLVSLSPLRFVSLLSADAGAFVATLVEAVLVVTSGGTVTRVN
jgi:hypothetical protein